MWKCPKCGREFSRREQPHYCGKPKTVEEYIAAQDEAVQPMLREIRDAVPRAEECISWSMPTYRKGVNLIHFAASRHHLGVYPGEDAVTAFGEELQEFDVSKGTIRLPWTEDLPAELIGKLARWCYDTYAGNP